MIRIDLTKSRLLAGVLVSASCLLVGTACGAQDYTSQPSVQQAPKSAEQQAADSRVDAARTKFDNAKMVLSAAKASLKAAEAEFKAARAERDAIALRTTAQQLADASGFASTTPIEPVRQMIVPPNGNRLTPVATQVTPVPVTSTPINGVPAVDFNGAPPPDLMPNPNAAPGAAMEPNIVP